MHVSSDVMPYAGSFRAELLRPTRSLGIDSGSEGGHRPMRVVPCFSPQDATAGPSGDSPMTIPRAGASLAFLSTMLFQPPTANADDVVGEVWTIPVQDRGRPIVVGTEAGRRSPWWGRSCLHPSRCPWRRPGGRRAGSAAPPRSRRNRRPPARTVPTDGRSRRSDRRRRSVRY